MPERNGDGQSAVVTHEARSRKKKKTKLQQS